MGSLRPNRFPTVKQIFFARLSGVNPQAFERHVPKRAAGLRLREATQAKILEHVFAHPEQHPALAPYLKRKLDRPNEACDACRDRVSAWENAVSSHRAVASAPICTCNA
jgi:hypothetical protein